MIPIALGVLLFLGCHAPSNGSSDSSSNSAGTFRFTKEMMPEGVEGVRLGLSLRELLALRPNVEADDFPRSPESSRSYSEQLEHHLLFSTITYDFVEGRLNTITLAGTWSREILQARRDEFLTKIFTVWGKPSRLATRPIQRKGVFHCPVLIWEGEGVSAAGSYAPSLAPDGQPYDISNEPFAPYFFEIVISLGGERGLAKDLSLVDISALTANELSNLFVDVTRLGLPITVGG